MPENIQGFGVEAPQPAPEKKKMPVVLKIILAIVGIGAFIMLAPFIFCFIVLLFMGLGSMIS